MRSERPFCERLQYDLLFKWFLDLNIMAGSFDHSVFAKNRQRLLDGNVAREFLLEVVGQARQQGLLSEEHLSADGTLLEAWASVDSFRPKDEDPAPPEGGGGNREAALEMMGSVPGASHITVGAGRGYDTRGFLQGFRQLLVTPHVAQKQRSALDRRATRHEGIALASGLGNGLRRSSAG